MATLYFTLGAAIIIVCIMDFLWTTLWVDGGAGPITKRASHLIWKTTRKISKDHPKILSLNGPLILSFTLFTWIMLLWIGWTLVFAGDANSIINPQSSMPITWLDRIYYAGYLIFTLGNGDFSPQGGTWKIASVLATGTGMLFITLGVTYLLSILGAVTQKRAFSESVMAVGKDGEQFVLNAWNGKDFHDLNLLLNTLAEQLGTITAQHKAYPILHYYYAEEQEEAIPNAVVVLDEALSVICYGIERQAHPNPIVLRETRSTIKSYIKTLQTVSFVPSKGIPPMINLDKFIEAKLPTLDAELYKKDIASLKDRRKKLAGLLEANALEWPGDDR